VQRVDGQNYMAMLLNLFFESHFRMELRQGPCINKQKYLFLV
jgi:hypothetical protein